MLQGSNASHSLNSINHFETAGAGVSVAGAGVAAVAAAGATVTAEVSVTVGVPATTSGDCEATAGAVSTVEVAAASSFFEQAERASRTVNTSSERII